MFDNSVSFCVVLFFWVVVGILNSATVTAARIDCQSSIPITQSGQYEVVSCGSLAAPLTVTIDIAGVELNITAAVIGSVMWSTSNVTLNIISCTVTGTFGPTSDSLLLTNVSIAVRNSTVQASGNNQALSFVTLSFVDSVVQSASILIEASTIAITSTSSLPASQVSLVRSLGSVRDVNVTMLHSTVRILWAPAQSSTAVFGIGGNARLLSCTGGGSGVRVLLHSVDASLTAGTEAVVVYLAESFFDSTSVTVESSVIALTAQGPRMVTAFAGLSGVRREAAVVVCDQVVDTTSIVVRNVTALATVAFAPATVTATAALVDAVVATMVRFYGSSSSVKVSRSSFAVTAVATTGGACTALVAALMFATVALMPSLERAPPSSLAILMLVSVSATDNTNLTVTVQDPVLCCSNQRTVSFGSSSASTNTLSSLSTIAHILVAVPLLSDVSLVVSDTSASIRPQNYRTCTVVPLTTSLGFQLTLLQSYRVYMGTVVVVTPLTVIATMANYAVSALPSLLNIKKFDVPAPAILRRFTVALDGFVQFSLSLSDQALRSQNENSTIRTGLVVVSSAAVPVDAGRWTIDVCYATFDTSFAVAYFHSLVPAVVLEEVRFNQTTSGVALRVWSRVVQTVATQMMSQLLRQFTTLLFVMPQCIAMLESVSSNSELTSANAVVSVSKLPQFVATANTQQPNAPLASLVTLFDVQPSFACVWVLEQLSWRSSSGTSVVTFFNVAGVSTIGISSAWPVASRVETLCCSANRKKEVTRADLLPQLYAAQQEINVKISNSRCFTLTRSLPLPITHTHTRSRTLQRTPSNVLPLTATRRLTISNDLIVQPPPTEYEHSREVIGGFVTLLRLSPQFPLAACVLQRSLAVAQLAEHCRNAAFYHPASDPIVYTGRGTVYDFRLATHRWMLSTRAENPLLLRVASLGGRVSEELLSVVGAVIGNAVLLVVWAGGFVLVRQAWRRRLWVGRNAPPHSVSVVPPLRACAPVLLYAYCALLQPSVQGGVAALGYLSHHNHDSATTGADATIGIVTIIVWGLPAVGIVLVGGSWLPRRSVFSFVKYPQRMFDAPTKSQNARRTTESPTEKAASVVTFALRGPYRATVGSDMGVAMMFADTSSFLTKSRVWVTPVVQLLSIMVYGVVAGVGWSRGTSTACKDVTWVLFSVQLLLLLLTAVLRPYASDLETICVVFLEGLCTLAVGLAADGNTGASDRASIAVAIFGTVHWLLFSWLRTIVVERALPSVDQATTLKSATGRERGTPAADGGSYKRHDSEIFYSAHREQMHKQRYFETMRKQKPLFPLSAELVDETLAGRLLRVSPEAFACGESGDDVDFIPQHPPEGLQPYFSDSEWHCVKVTFLANRFPLRRHLARAMLPLEATLVLLNVISRQRAEFAGGSSVFSPTPADVRLHPETPLDTIGSVRQADRLSHERTTEVVALPRFVDDDDYFFHDGEPAFEAVDETQDVVQQSTRNTRQDERSSSGSAVWRQQHL